MFKHSFLQVLSLPNQKIFKKMVEMLSRHSAVQICMSMFHFSVPGFPHQHCCLYVQVKEQLRMNNASLDLDLHFRLKKC